MENRIDIVVFGATGFTGRYILLEAHKLKNISWGIAGRNEKKLNDTLWETSKRSNISDIKSIPIILANIDDKISIRNMTAQTKVLINCCGPYDLHGGDVVVKSCIETGTHYIDVSAEGLFIESILLKYRKAAEDKGVFIVNACGFDCIPFDLGICFMETKFDGTLNSVEIYLSKHSDNSTGALINYSTWESVIHAMSNFQKLKNIRKQLNEKQITGFKPTLSIKLPHKFKSGWAVPFPGTDADVVRRSQLYFLEEGHKRPIQMHNYIIINSLWLLIVTLVLGLLCLFFSQFPFGRTILLKYPEFFSHGVFSRGSPTEDDLNQNNFLLTLKGKGWSNKLSTVQNPGQPDKEIIVHISGTNPAYGVTGIAVVLCASMIILEPNKLPPRGGIYTPAIMFSKTTLVEQLQKNGINFEVISITNVNT